MATYKGIQGYSVQTLASDPSPTASVEGQLWYNSTSGAYKIAVSGTAGWAAGADQNAPLTGRGGAGPATATINFGGATAISPSGNVGNAETYDGTTWTEVNNLTGSRRYLDSAQQGTQTAALAISGTTGPSDVLVCETYNGTSWTEVGDTNVNHQSGAGAGTSTAALAITAGAGGSPKQDVESWNGTAWTQIADLVSAANMIGGAGSQTAALRFTGQPPAPPYYTGFTETWNGTSWTETNNTNTARYQPGGAGTSTLAIVTGGDVEPRPAVTANTETWNGTSWTEVGNLGTARKSVSSSGTTSSAIIGGGEGPIGTILDTTEIWSDPFYAVKTVTVS